MSKYPYLSDEVDIDKIDFSCINYNDNRQFCYINYDKPNETLFLQTPIFRFIHPITTQYICGKKYSEIYLFLTPQDQTTSKFINLITNIENKGSEYIRELINKEMILIPFIKTSEIDLDLDSNPTQKPRQVIKYIKIKLLDQTKIEYNKKIITIEELNELPNKVNLKLIFEINMMWLTQNKLGIYAKPLKIRAIDIVNEPNVTFRDEDDIIAQNDGLQTEADNFKHILNGTSLMSLNDSVFNTKIEQQKPMYTETTNIQLNAFIPSSGIDNVKQQPEQRPKLMSEINNDGKKQIDNLNSDISDSVNSMPNSGSSVKIQKYARKNKKSEKKVTQLGIKTNKKLKSIDKLKKLLNNSNDESDTSGSELDIQL